MHKATSCKQPGSETAQEIRLPTFSNWSPAGRKNLLPRVKSADRVAESRRFSADGPLCLQTLPRPQVTGAAERLKQVSGNQRPLAEGCDNVCSTTSSTFLYLLTERPIETLQDTLKRHRLLQRLACSLGVGRDQNVLIKNPLPIMHPAGLRAAGPLDHLHSRSKT